METLARTLWLLLTNPNIIYLLLVVGVWSSVMAVLIPGTGLAEAAAVICFALAAVGLFQFPVNLAGLGLIGLALLLFVLEFQFQAHGALLLGGSAIMAIGALLLFRVGEQRSQAALSWVSVALVTLITTGAFGFVVRKGLAAQRAPALQDPGRLLGALGVTRTAVEREGTVYVAGEDWSATADEPIPVGTEVVVLAREGLRLKVARAPGSQETKGTEGTVGTTGST